MRPSALKTEQGYDGILRGLWLLIPVIMGIFIFRTTGINSPDVQTGPRGKGFVQIEGDIKNPGVYPFNNQSDVKGLIELGGDIKSFAGASRGLEGITIHSGSKIIVKMDHVAPGLLHEEMTSFHKITLGIPVSINGESEEGLTAVPGIGPLLAKGIVKKRTELGGFKAIEELRSVHGIGEKTYNKIITYVTL